MSDTIVVMNEGEIQQIGSPIDIYNEPKNSFVAQFIGESNILEGIAVEDKKVMFSNHIFDSLDKGFDKNQPVDVVIRPEDIEIVPVDQGMINGEVKEITFKGVHWEMIVNAEGFNYKVHSINDAKINSQVGLKIIPDAIHVMNKED